MSKGEGRTVLFVSHNMAAVEALCNTAITLKNGRLIDSGNPSKLIKNYLIENSNTNRKIRFSNIEEAIGNNAIKILSASVNNASSNNTDDIIDLSSDIEITFELLNLTNNPEISIGFDLKTTRGEILFGSGRVILCPNHKNTTVTCQIPGNLLNDDTYQILLYVHTKAMGLLFMKDEILSFEIKDAKREEGYLGKVNGFIRPTLTWK